MISDALLSNFLVAMIAIVNPVGKIPIWIEACEGHDAPVRWRLAAMLVATAFAVLLVSLVFGGSILEFFGIDLAAFRIGGGIVILWIGLNMLQGRSVDIERGGEGADGNAYEKAKARFRGVVVPLAIPILAGPGSISTAILFGSRAEDWWTYGAMAGVLFAVMLAVMVVLLGADRIRALVGDLVLDVQTRLFGLILCAIAAQLLVEGLGEVFPQWLSPESPIADDVKESAEAARSAR